MKNTSAPSSAQSSPGWVPLPLDGMLNKNPSNENNAAVNSAASSQNTYDMVEIQMSNERENIVKDLLRVLASISQVNMEPNGGSFVRRPQTFLPFTTSPSCPHS